jgi:hypothetical protein
MINPPSAATAPATIRDEDGPRQSPPLEISSRPTTDHLATYKIIKMTQS